MLRARSAGAPEQRAPADHRRIAQARLNPASARIAPPYVGQLRGHMGGHAAARAGLESPVGSPGCPRRQDEIASEHAQHLRTKDASGGWPCRERDDKNDHAVELPNRLTINTIRKSAAPTARTRCLASAPDRSLHLASLRARRTTRRARTTQRRRSRHEEDRVPCTTPENRSRPRSSVPNKCAPPDEQCVACDRGGVIARKPRGNAATATRPRGIVRRSSRSPHGLMHCGGVRRCGEGSGDTGPRIQPRARGVGQHVDERRPRR